MSRKGSLKNIDLEMISVDEETAHPEDRQNSILTVIDMVLGIVIAVIAVLLIQMFFLQHVTVEGLSMNPTLESGDIVMVNKISYLLGSPSRYDVVVFAYDKTKGSDYVKRIIGLPGETVQIIDGYVYIDGKKLEDDTYGTEIIKNAGIASDEIVLGEDEYFVLGDNRNESSDSRVAEVGVVNIKQIEGKVWFVMWPFDRFKTVK